jgi:Zn-finger nucleic acid-binding protein
MTSRRQKKDEKEARRQLDHLFRRELDGVEAANRAVAALDPDCTMIFLTRSEYQDLLIRSRLPELASYKGKHITVVSDRQP